MDYLVKMCENKYIEREILEVFQGEETVHQKQDVEALLRQGNHIQVHVQGYSMFPLLDPERDMVVIAPVKRVRKGEVYLYRREKGILVLHRLVRKDQKGLYFAGDNQVEVEGPLSVDQLRGQMVRFIRKGHTYSTKHLGYFVFSRIWMFLRPLRPVISNIAHKCKTALGGR